MKARPAAVTLALAALLAAGCGSSPPAAGNPAPWAPPGGTRFLATSVDTAAGTWAVVVMGGSVASRNNFWQLFARPAESGRWKLVTPPGVADNGGLALTGVGGQSLIAGFRPSQGLTYTPLVRTSDGGQTWSTTGPLDAALANAPDALATAPRTGQLLALTTGGAAELATPAAYAQWHIIASRRALATTPAGRRCRLAALAAAAFTPAGTPLLAGSCARPATVGIFALRGRAWQAAGPALPGKAGQQRITVLRLTATSTGLVALLQAGTGPDATLFAGWSAGNSARWDLSPPLQLGPTTPTSVSFGPDGAAAVTLGGDRGETITAGGQWHRLPALPPGTATLAPGPGGQADALAVHRTKLAVWQLWPGGATWVKAQVINVPIQFGSSS